MIRRARRRTAPATRPRPPRHLRTGVLGLLVLVLASALILTGRGLPAGGPGRTLHADVAEIRGLRAGAPVRVAGVAVGRVEGIELRDSGLARVTIGLGDDAPALRAGTRLRIHPRVFLEGGYAVQLEPGPPGGAELADGAVLPAASTAASVPLPAVTGTLDAATRDGLRGVARELDRALARSGDARRLARSLSPMLRDATALARAARGEDPDDLRGLLRSAAAVTAALDAEDGRLAGTVVGVRRVATAAAGEERALRATLRELPGIADRAPAALRAVRRARPTVDALLRDLDPALRAAPSALRAADGTLRQAGALAAPAELPALLRDARPLVRELRPGAEDGAAVLDGALPLLRCVRDRLVPAFGRTVPDGALTTGTTVLQELLGLSAGLSSAGAPFDANGWLVRLAATVGPRVLTVGSSAGVGPFAASTPGIAGARPAWYGSRGLPPFRPDAVCADQALPDLEAASRAVPTTRARTGHATPTGRPPAGEDDLRRLRRQLRAWLDGSSPDGGVR